MCPARWQCAFLAVTTCCWRKQAPASAEGGAKKDGAELAAGNVVDTLSLLMYRFEPADEKERI